MKKLLWNALILISWLRNKSQANPLAGKRFKLNRRITQRYLTSRGVFPEHLIHKLDESMDKLSVEFTEDRILAYTRKGDFSMSCKAYLFGDQILFLRVFDENNKVHLSKLRLKRDGYWQETERFWNYLERFYEINESTAESPSYDAPRAISGQCLAHR